MNDSHTEYGVVVPLDRLSDKVIRGVIEDFVLREGTDYGSGEYSLDEKVNMVRRQLERGQAQIVFDAATETCSIRRS